jgi:uncharacterized protein (TIGR02246 family)
MTTQTTNGRPALDRPADDTEAREAVALLIGRLQKGIDESDADSYDSLFADDLLWGSPKGQVLQGYIELNSIHRSMMGSGTTVAPASRFELVQRISPAPDVVVAQIRRQATLADGAADPEGFSEMAMYVLVRRDERWWLAAGQNTPVSDVLPNR